jgi:hypothetical protein
VKTTETRCGAAWVLAGFRFGTADAYGLGMVGVITERDLAQAEEAFPGISRFFEALPVKPRTFLELVRGFQRWCQPADAPRAA